MLVLVTSVCAVVSFHSDASVASRATPEELLGEFQAVLQSYALCEENCLMSFQTRL